MRYFLIIQIVLFSSFNFETLSGQTIQQLTFNEFEPLLHKENDTVYIVNFWATWCVPCIKELPSIEQVAENYRKDKVKVLLVSLDMPNQVNSRLIPFLQKHQIKSEVILLNDPDFNRWINRVNDTWSGAIPASLVYTENQRIFYEKSLEYQELEQIIKPLIRIK